MGSRIKTLIEAPDASGRILGVNKKRLNEYPVLLDNNPSSNVQVATSNGMKIPMLASSPSVPTIIRVSADGPVIVHALGIETLGAATCMLQLQDGRDNTTMMSSAINVACMFGSQGTPLYLPEALYLDERRALTAIFTDISGSANYARPIFHSAKYTEVQADPTMERLKARMGERQYLTMPYFYTFKPSFVQNIPAGMSRVLANATNYEEINIGTDHYFELFGISCTSTGLFGLNIVEADNGDSLIDSINGTNYAVASSCICGNGNFPFKFHESRLFHPNTKLTVTLTDLSGSDNNVAIALIGRIVATQMKQVIG